LIDFNQIHRF